MSEADPRGPLDIVRDITGLAEELDQQALAIEHDDEDALIELQALVRETETGHPLMGHDVIVYGSAVAADIQRVIRKWRQMSEPEHFSQTGKYRGLTVCETTDAEDGGLAYRVAHMIHTGSSDPEPDGLGNIDQKHYLNFILSRGSEVSPVLPINAHSAHDLEGDAVVAAANEVLYDDELDRSEKIILLGEVVNDVLAGERQVDDELNQQRASYINSFGIHEVSHFSVQDLLIGDKDTAEATGEFELASMEDVISVRPDMFDIMSGYVVAGDSDELLTGPEELCARAEMKDHPYLLLMPLKNVLGVDLS